MKKEFLHFEKFGILYPFQKLIHLWSALRPKKKLLCCPLPTDRKMRKNRVVFFFFFFLCQIWAKNLLKFVFNGLKKHLHDLYICVLTAFRPSFPHLETLKKILENSTLSRYVKKKKKKKNPDRPTQFSNFGRVRAT